MFWVNFQKGEKPYFYRHTDDNTYNVCKIFLEDRDGKILDTKTKEIVAEDKYSLFGLTIKDNKPLRFKKSKKIAVNDFGQKCPWMQRYEVPNGIYALDGGMNIPVNNKIIHLSTALADDYFLADRTQKYIEEGYGIISTIGYIPKGNRYTMRGTDVVTKAYIPIGMLNYIKNDFKYPNVENLTPYRTIDKNNWIDCEERMPEDGEKCIARYDEFYGCVYGEILTYQKEKNRFMFWDSNNDCEAFLDANDVVAWMPSPKRYF